ncbi:MAG: type IX secretion system membrane protein PorP/SprF [Bacteroidetes bacterium]|nr:type IX secretion system membrane protein PorP/SprF [Bacteroidota bacterium]
MKKLLANVTLVLAFLFIALNASAQDPQYSQFYANQLMLNPAFTGSGIGPRIAMNYRAQWVKIPGYYKQFAFSYDQPVHFLGTTQGLGINFNSDVAGEGNLTKLNVNLNYAYQVEIVDDHFLRFGLAGGIQQASIDFYKLRFPDQIDPRNGFVRPTSEPANISNAVIRPDVSAGIAYFNEYAWLGFTVNHITEPVEVFTQAIQNSVDAKLPRKYTVTGGVRIPLRDMRNRRELSITPVFLYKMQGEFFQIDGGLYVNAEPMVFGLWYRHQDAMIGLIGVRQGPFRFGYSYDYTISDLTQRISGGSHEISVILEFEQYQKGKPLRHKRMPCPRF